MTATWLESVDRSSYDHQMSNASPSCGTLRRRRSCSTPYESSCRRIGKHENSAFRHGRLPRCDGQQRGCTGWRIGSEPPQTCAAKPRLSECILLEAARAPDRLLMRGRRRSCTFGGYAARSTVFFSETRKSEFINEGCCAPAGSAKNFLIRIQLQAAAGVIRTSSGECAIFLSSCLLGHRKVANRRAGDLRVQISSRQRSSLLPQS
ncbi:hypothetical protein DENSPDRAFT_575092 [Dentipellis sp. KUC8613]|nr:hypothetical protein DENSPDRAFT_575092 [Dentipellis sp. KUC8613]